MGRGPELQGDVVVRILGDVLDEGVVAEGSGLDEFVANKYAINQDYVRQVFNELEDRELVLIEREGRSPIAYDIHPSQVAWRDHPWPPSQMLQALLDARDAQGRLSQDRYNAYAAANGAPPSSAIIETFHAWDRAMWCAGFWPGTDEDVRLTVA